MGTSKRTLCFEPSRLSVRRSAHRAIAALKACESAVLQKGIDVNGRGGGIRTPGPLLPKQMRYQAALRPDVPL